MPRTEQRWARRSCRCKPTADDENNQQSEATTTAILWNQVQEADLGSGIPGDHTSAFNPGAEECGLLPTQVH